MNGHQIAAPVGLDHRLRSESALIKSRFAIGPGEQPQPLVAILPGSSGKKWRHRCPGVLSGEYSGEEVARGAEKGKLIAVYLPGIVAVAALHLRRRDRPRAQSSRQKCGELACRALQPSAQIAWPGMIVRHRQGTHEFPAAGIILIDRNLLGFEHQQSLIITNQIEDGGALAQDKSFLQGKD